MYKIYEKLHLIKLLRTQQLGFWVALKKLSRISIFHQLQTMNITTCGSKKNFTSPLFHVIRSSTNLTCANFLRPIEMKTIDIETESAQQATIHSFDTEANLLEALW